MSGIKNISIQPKPRKGLKVIEEKFLKVINLGLADLNLKTYI
jgi:hypothetical protein